MIGGAMKKISFLIICLFFMIYNVYAKENKLYFTNDGNKLYYDSELFDDDIFISNLDMVPGREYVDKLVIKNNADIKYRLYLKINKKQQEELSEGLLNSIKMQIKLDGNLIDDGFASGADYSKKHKIGDLEDSIYIGEYSSNEIGNLEVITKLVESYNYSDESVTTKIQWEFFAQYDDKLILINPDTGVDKSNNLIVNLIAILIIFVILIEICIKFLRNKVNN